LASDDTWKDIIMSQHNINLDSQSLMAQ
jgi:hypothetical protein